MPPDAAETITAISTAAARAGCTIIAERLPSALWESIPTPMPNAPLAARVLTAFDPGGILNPGLAPRHAPRPPDA